MMRRPVTKYLIALMLFTLFSGGLATTVFPNLLKGNSWSLLQKQECDNDSSPSENSKGIEREFEAEIASGDLPSPSSEILSHHYHRADSSFPRSCYSSVPTPPPNCFRIGFTFD